MNLFLVVDADEGRWRADKHRQSVGPGLGAEFPQLLALESWERVRSMLRAGSEMKVDDAL